MGAAAGGGIDERRRALFDFDSKYFFNSSSVFYSVEDLPTQISHSCVPPSYFTFVIIFIKPLGQLTDPCRGRDVHLSCFAG